jgi:alkylation response protein AidB-like acyl-CoA dehydrogenase
MNFSFSDEQQMLRDSLRSFLDDRYSCEQRRTAIQTQSGWRPELWTAFAADLGILGMCLPERAGGSGIDHVSAMVVMEELGRALVVEPFLETVIVCGCLLSHAGGTRALRALSEIASGGAIFAFAWAEPASGYDFAAVSTREAVGPAARARVGRIDGQGDGEQGLPLRRTECGSIAWRDGDDRRTRGQPLFQTCHHD